MCLVLMVIVNKSLLKGVSIRGDTHLNTFALGEAFIRVEALPRRHSIAQIGLHKH